MLGRYLRVAVLAAGLVAGSVGSAMASGGVTLPTVNCDVGQYVTAFGQAFGTIVATIVGLYFAFLVIRYGLKWAKKAA